MMEDRTTVRGDPDFHGEAESNTTPLLWVDLSSAKSASVV